MYYMHISKTQYIHTKHKVHTYIYIHMTYIHTYIHTYIQNGLQVVGEPKPTMYAVDVDGPIRNGLRPGDVGYDGYSIVTCLLFVVLCTYVRMYVCMYMYINVCMCKLKYVCMYVCNEKVFKYPCICVCMYVCMYINVCMCK
jgi:hypothetical protein